MKPVSGIPGTDFSVEDVRGTFPNELEITPLDHPPDVTMRVPGSKSVTNRALLLAALDDGAHPAVLDWLEQEDFESAEERLILRRHLQGAISHLHPIKPAHSGQHVSVDDCLTTTRL